MGFKASRNAARDPGAHRYFVSRENRDQGIARRSAETLAAASALIAAEMAAAGPDVYISDEKGPTRVSSM